MFVRDDMSVSPATMLLQNQPGKINQAATMKKIFAAIGALALVTSSQTVKATIYNDSANDLFGGAGGGGILDITSVEVTNDPTDLFFKIFVNTASITSPDWGKYTIGIDTVPGGDTSSPVGNPWGRNIRMSSGMDYWIGSWVDSGGGRQLWNYSGSWSGPASSGVTILGNSVSFSVPLASLGLSPGNTFTFDVYTTGGGGGDTAVDALGNPGIAGANWGDPYDSGANVVSYTVTPVPEPALAALIGLGGLMIVQRSFRRR